jgi:hypothetical protein
MAATIGIIGSIASVAAPVVGVAAGINSLVGGGSSTKNSGGTPQTATGGQSANILPPGELGAAGLQYLNGATGLQGYGQGYINQFFPQVAGATQAAAYNPYSAQALSGASQGADYGINTLAPQLAAGASSLYGLGGQLSPYVAQLLAQSGQSTPGAAYESQYLRQAATPISGMQYADQALATGFAPNNGLYKQQLQQTTDQSNAINAMYGLSQSPYGANLTDQAVQSFNNAFNLNQANLQAQAASTYTGLLNANLANQTGNLNAYNSLAGTDLNQRLGLGGLAQGLGGLVSNLYSGADTLGTGAFNTYGAASTLPAQTYQGLANNSLAAFGTGAQNANATLNPFTTYLNSLGNIIGLGQIGQQNAASQAQAGFGQQQLIGQNLGQSLAQLGGQNGQPSPLQTLWDQIGGSSAYNPYQSSPYQIQATPLPPPSFDLSSLSLPDLSMFG